MAKRVEVVPTKAGRSSLGRKNLLVSSDEAKVLVAIGAATLYVKKEPPQTYQTRDMVAVPRVYVRRARAIQATEPKPE